MRGTVVICFAILVLATLATNVKADHDQDDYNEEKCAAYYLYSDYKFSGGPMGLASAGTKPARDDFDCYEICWNTTNCLSFTYGEGRCYMYKELEFMMEYEYAEGFTAGYINLKNFCVRAHNCGPAFYYADNYKFSGGTSAGTKPARNVSNCYGICWNTTDCLSFTYGRGRCYMYKEIEDMMEYKNAKGFTAGYINLNRTICLFSDKDYCKDENWDFGLISKEGYWVGVPLVGPRYGTYAGTVDACAGLCIETEDCYTFSYRSDKRCYMSGEDSNGDMKIEYLEGYLAGWIYCNEGDDDKKKMFPKILTK